MDAAATDTDATQLHQLTYKRAQFVTCPACRHGGTTVLVKERLPAWRYAVEASVNLVFASLTMGIMLYFLPLIFRPQFVTHSCRRCGLRLAIATAAHGESQFTIPMDVEDDCFIPAPEDWRPDLARLPSGMRVARSPLGPRPEISEREMKVCNTRFLTCHPRAQFTLLAGNTLGRPIRCMRAGANNAGGRRSEQPSSSTSHGHAEVLYEIHSGGINTPVTVMMRPPPENSVTEELPSYTKQLRGTDKQTPAKQQEPAGAAQASAQAPQPFTQACRIFFYSGDDRKYSSAMYLPPQSTSGSETAYVNAVPADQRMQFSAYMPVWRWRSSRGGLLWVYRRFRDANMAALKTRLCLVDDYGRVVAVLDNWNGLRFLSVMADQFGGGGDGLGRQSVLTLYADLGAALLGEVLGSLCALALQIWRVTAELNKEKDENRGDCYS
ncbi:uncharacterized protein J7T54_004159 [Emericellopsis cladophorae]|uniref:LITAF domain-containing protein n=1 Tax=Emericellopsis cladophorae TaxID=2686198 RepID=A0A9Q0BAP4_9HYPO|nr:uncharacterized protein J7T54_004159 [Emericellopsis cladophorae]KAI6777740.1 hypothetical protein J7T54_004159 [Emericellopsis cladophorae]